ncbi:ankyrin repeat domain-containing protein [Rickettsiella endosymbiont of Miltochrista miniata]|uniref:ankyrin repeat domain-containing protein n=1 Tax=Rickettsiella endosymbiont of Miltochrista miniata TaxID=3066239 RepID=UPI00313F302A
MRKSTKKLHIAIKYNIPLDLSLQKTLKDAVIKRDYSSVRRLLKNGANPNEQDNEGLTPLHFAAKDNRVVIASLLIQNGADIMINNKAGHTPLDYAVTHNFSALQQLFEKKLERIVGKNIYNTISFFKNFSSEVDKNSKNISNHLTIPR